MATPILNADLNSRLLTIEERLATAQSSAKALLVLKESALVMAALEDALAAFESIRSASYESVVLINLTLLAIEKSRA